MRKALAVMGLKLIKRDEEMGPVMNAAIKVANKVNADKAAANQNSGSTVSISNASSGMTTVPQTNNDYLSRIGLGRGRGINIADRISASKIKEEDAAYQSKLAETESMRGYDKVFGTYTAEAYPEDPAIARAQKAQAFIDSRIKKGADLSIAPLKVGLERFNPRRIGIGSINTEEEV